MNPTVVGRLTRRGLLLGALALTAGCAQQAAVPSAGLPPIVFVHGNGDSAALWTTTVWRFESNGWPRDRLHAIELPYPQARDLDDKPQPGRSSSDEHRQFLAGEVDRVLQRTGAKQVVLFGNSRGGIAIRNYVAHGGAPRVSHVILGGTPNHGVWNDATFLPTSEFNGAGPLLRALNHQGAPGVEVTPGPRWMTIRSDGNDKYAQPDGVWIGRKGWATNVGFDGPELKGALNVVLPGVDHRETAFGPGAFAAAYRFVTGREPGTRDAVPDVRVVLDGLVSGQGVDNDPARGSAPSNLPLAGASVEVHETRPDTGERVGAARWRKTIGADGRWGPFEADRRAHYEFVISAPGYAVTHVYRSPFPRSSSIVGLRAMVLPPADRGPGSVVTLTRPRGYFGLPRDTIMLDGQSPPPGIAPGVAGVAVSRVKLPPGPERAIAGEFNGERIVGRSWSAADNHLVQLELHR